jgi:sugar lactone lactonase YvrE
MYYNDTYAGKVYAIPCGADGTPDALAQWRTIVTLDADTQGAPDGLAIDTEHRLWVAHESGGKVAAVNASLLVSTGDVHDQSSTPQCSLSDRWLYSNHPPT